MYVGFFASKRAQDQGMFVEKLFLRIGRGKDFYLRNRLLHFLLLRKQPPQIRANLCIYKYVITIAVRHWSTSDMLHKIPESSQATQRTTKTGSYLQELPCNQLVVHHYKYLGTWCYFYNIYITVPRTPPLKSIPR